MFFSLPLPSPFELFAWPPASLCAHLIFFVFAGWCLCCALESNLPVFSCYQKHWFENKKQMPFPLCCCHLLFHRGERWNYSPVGRIKCWHVRFCKLWTLWMSVLHLQVGGMMVSRAAIVLLVPRRKWSPKQVSMVCTNNTMPTIILAVGLEMNEAFFKFTSACLTCEAKYQPRDWGLFLWGATAHLC